MTEKYFDINKEGCSVRCKLYAGDVKAVKKAVVFLHGFGGHKDTRAAAKFAEHTCSKYTDTAVVTFDLPCHGSDGRKKLTLDDCALYIHLVTGYIKERFSTDDIYAYATSFGGYLTLKYIYEEPRVFVRAVLRCPAIRMYESISKRIATDEDIKKLSRGKDIELGFDRKVRVNKSFFDELENADITKYDFIEYADDILIIHGTLDEIVPIEYTEKFCDDNVIELIRVERADHRFTDPKKLDIANNAAMRFLLEGVTGN